MSELFDLDKYKIDSHYVIEASAGTGKTYNIIEIVKKIVRNDFDRIKKILIVTYTEKAAGELKDRIKKEIPQIDLNDAHIYTIHSFCKNTISEFGITSNLPLDLDLVGELDLIDFSKRYFREGLMYKTVIALQEAGYKVNPEKLESKFKEGISHYYLDFNNNEDESVSSLEKVGSTDYEGVREVLFDAYNTNSFDDFASKYPEIKRNYDILNESSDPNANAIARDIETNYRCLFSKKPVLGKLKPTEKEAAKYFIELYKHFGGSKDDREDFVINFISQVFFKDFYIRWQEEKIFNKAQSFDDMIRYIRETIRINPQLVNKLREKYTYGIIDEFQDTNQRQFDIFKEIFLCDNHYLIVVGDPKQSIYAFQGADVSVYDKAKKEISNIGTEASLGKNWRSSDKMVEFANNYFSEENGWSFGDIAKFTPSQWSGKYSASYKNEPAKPVWIGATKDGNVVDVQEYARIAVEQIIECCTIDENGNTNLQLYGRKEEDGGKNVTFKDFTILARTRSEFGYIKAELRRAGIPFVQYKDTSLFKNSKECYQWIYLLQAIAAPDFTGSNRKYLRRALFTDFFGLELYEINDEAIDKDDIEEVNIIRSWRQLALKREWDDLVDSILTKSRLFTTLNELNKMQSFNKFKQLGDYAVEYLYANHTLDDLIRALVNLSSGSEEDEGGSIVGKGTEFNSVQLMTMHASKGLEFPVVISVGGFKGIYPRANTFTYHKDGKLVLSFKKVKETNGPLITNELIEEYKRIYYVAYTRAKYLLMLPNYGADFSIDLDFLDISITNFMNNHEDLYQIVSLADTPAKTIKGQTRKLLEYHDRNKKKDTHTQVEQGNKIQELISKESKLKAYKHSYSSLSHPKHEDVEDDGFNDDIDLEGEKGENLADFDKNNTVKVEGKYKDVDPMTFPKKFPKGNKIGSALHEVFEKLDYQDYEPMIDQVTKNAFEAQLIPLGKESNEKVKEMVQRVLNADFPLIEGNKQVKDKYFKLNELSLNDKKAEAEYNYKLLLGEKNANILRNYLNGFIDLMFVHNNRYSIIDWKSDTLNEDEFKSYKNYDDLKLHTDNAYSIQRVLYVYCLIKWLRIYYPNETEEEIFNNRFGGIYYVFIRGCEPDYSNGIYSHTWESYKDLEDAFNNIINQRVGRK